MKMDVSWPPAGENGEEAMLEDIASEISGFKRERSSLIPILQLIQRKHAFLSHEAMRIVARHFGISAIEVNGVDIFYNQFRFHPPGRHHIKICMGTACHVVGSDIILENFGSSRISVKETR